MTRTSKCRTALVSHLGVRDAALQKEQSQILDLNLPTFTYHFASYKLTGSQSAPRPTRSIICIPKETPRVPEQPLKPTCSTHPANRRCATCTRKIPGAGAAVFRAARRVLRRPQRSTACCESHGTSLHILSFFTSLKL